MSMPRRLTLALALSLLPLALPAQRPAADPRAAARSWRESNEGAILAEFRDLLAIPNVASDTSDIRRNARALMAMLERRGAKARLLEVEGANPAVLGELDAPGATRTVGLYAHYDGQPVDPKQWTGGGPFTPVLRDRALTAGGRDIPFPASGARTDPENRIYARSAGDDKGSIIAMLSALDALKAAGIAPSVNLRFFFEGEEEAGSPNLERILRTYASDLKADAWLFCDGPVHQSGRQQVLFGLRGVTGLELTVYGPNRALHSGHYGNWAPNPAVMIARLIASMRDDDGRILIRGYYDDVRPISKSEREALRQMPSVDSLLRRTFALAPGASSATPIAEGVMRPALNVRGIRVGNVKELAANAISPEAYASFDFRLVPDQSPDRVRQLVEAHIRSQGYFVTHDSVTEAVRLAHPKIARLRWESGYPASRTSMDLPFSRALLRVVGEGAPKPPLAVPTMGGSGPTYLFERVMKVPMLVLPIANFDDNQHAFDENLRLGNLWDGIETFASLVARLGHEWDAKPVP
jgi:acetylornithine deacetylase/succinyl-diaminopimelate desuccinylase-like protein